LAKKRKKKGLPKTSEMRIAEDLLAEMQRRPERPIEVLAEDRATLEGLIDLLILGPKSHPEGLFTEEELSRHIDRYGSVMTGLVMTLIEKRVITEEELEMGILSYHFALHHAPPDSNCDQVFVMRRNHLRALLEVRDD